MNQHPTIPSLQEPTLEQFHALLGRAIKDGLSREEMQRMVRAPRTRGPQLVPYGEKPPIIIRVTRERHPHKILENFPDLVPKSHIGGMLFGSPPNGELNLPSTRGFYQLCRLPDREIKGESRCRCWDDEGHLAMLGLKVCDIWDLLAWYDHIGRHINPELLSSDWQVMTKTNLGFFTKYDDGYSQRNDSSSPSGVPFLAAIFLNDRRCFTFGVNGYPSDYDYYCLEKGVYILGRRDVD